MSGIVISGTPQPVDERWLTVRNFKEDGLYRFKPRGIRSGPEVTEVVLHETVTRSSDVTLRVLRKQGYGIHFLIGPDGVVDQHADLLDVVYQAGDHNFASVGIELVNPYYPKYLTKRTPWHTVIDAPWAHGDRYVVPLLPQLESAAKLVFLLCAFERLSIPRLWIGEHFGTMVMGRVNDHQLPGIYAHHYFGHSDGAFLAVYAWLRMEAMHTPERALEVATNLARGVRKRVTLPKRFGWGVMWP